MKSMLFKEDLWVAISAFIKLSLLIVEVGSDRPANLQGLDYGTRSQVNI